jgi:DNA polymerase-3 subunit alpha
VGKRSLEALIQSGACDSFGHRAQLMAALDTVVREAQLRHEEKTSGQVSLFDLAGTGASIQRPAPLLPEVPRWPEGERLAREKEVLGFFITGHPLEKFRDELGLFSHVTTANLKQHKDQKVELPCVVTAVTRQISRRNGAEWARITVEDFAGTATVLAFGEAWDMYHDALAQDSPVLIRGTVSGRERDEEAPPIFLDGVVSLATLRASGALGVEVTLAAGLEETAVSTALQLFREHPGPAPVYVRWAAGNGRNGETSAQPEIPETRTTRLRSRTITVLPSDALLVQLRELFGETHIRLVRT